MSSQQAVNFVRKKLIELKDVSKVAAMLVDKALALASNDNVTAMIVVFGRSFDVAEEP